MTTFLTPLLHSVKTRITEKYTPYIKNRVKKHRLFAVGSALFMATYVFLISYTNQSELNLVFRIMVALPYTIGLMSLVGNMILSIHFSQLHSFFKYNLIGCFNHTIPNCGQQDIKLTPEENQQLFALPFEQTHLDYLINAIENYGYISHDDLQYIEDVLQGFSNIKKVSHCARENTITFMKDNNISIDSVDNIEPYTLLQNVLSNKKVMNGKSDVKKIL